MKISQSFHQNTKAAMQRTRWILILLIFKVISIKFVKINGFELDKWQLSTQQTTKTVDEAFKQYFEGRTNLLHVRVQLDFSDSWQNKVIDNLAEVLRNSKQMAYIINIQNREDQSANRFYYNNIWYVDSFRALRAILPDFKNYQGNFAGYYIVVMHLTYDHEDPMPVVRQALKVMNDMQIVNVNIAVANSSNQMVIYSYDAFRPDGCLDVKPVIKNYFINGRFVHNELFPDKMTNFHKCKIIVLARNVAPFLAHNSKQHRRIPMDSITGIEANMIKVIANHLNFTPVMTTLPADSWGDIYENGSITGPFALLSNRTVDVLMGFFTYEPGRILHFSETISYLILPMVAVVNYKREIQHISPTWMIDPLMMSTWICMFAFVIGVIVSLSFTTSWSKAQIPQQRRNGQPKWLDVIGISLGVSCPINDGNRFGIRAWIITWALGFMICGAAYQGQLFVAYKHLHSSKPLTLDELKNGNYTFYVRHTFSNERLLRNDLQVPPDRIVRIHTNDANDIYERLVNTTKKVGTLAIKMRVLYFMVNNGYYNELHTPPEVLRLRQVCAYFRPRSYLLKPFNDVIGILSNNGFISKWNNEAEYELEKKYSRFQIQNFQPYPRPLDMKTFALIFYIHIGILTLAILVFYCEFYLEKRRMSRMQREISRRKQILMHLSRSIDNSTIQSNPNPN